jgi:16S rRNA (adenine1518-N6/adenine1519-N6)-dimethyltransferase
MKQPFAKRSLGQNFLVDQNYVRKIITALDLKQTDCVIEIGPGHGAITEHLVSSGASTIAVELDRDLVPLLREQFPANPNFTVVEADATEIDFSPLIAKTGAQEAKAKLVANLPYYISTPILQHLSTQRHLFESLVLMFQKEVVDRITAKPGDSERGFLTVLTEAAFQVKKLFDVPPTAFRPVPKVTSSVARFTPKGTTIQDERNFRNLVSEAFSQKRKTILNNLKNAYPNAKEALEASAIDSNRRAESLMLEEWLSLTNNLDLCNAGNLDN